MKQLTAILVVIGLVVTLTSYKSFHNPENKATVKIEDSILKVQSDNTFEFNKSGRDRITVNKIYPPDPRSKFKMTICMEVTDAPYVKERCFERIKAGDNSIYDCQRLVFGML